MAKREIERGEWSSFLDHFSRQHDGWLASLKVVGPDVGEKEEAEGLPFHGITYETKGTGRNDISIFLGQGTQEDETHTVTNPTHIRFEQTEQGADQGLEVESGDGEKAIVRFLNPMRPEAVDRL